MKKGLVLCAALASAAAVMAQPNNEWNGKPTVFGVNTLTPHVTSMPTALWKKL